MRNIIELWKRWLAKAKKDSMYEEIKCLAYQKAKSRNFEPGRDWEDWFEAEKEIASKYYDKYCGVLSTD
jgi:hypothetical protein